MRTKIKFRWMLLLLAGVMLAVASCDNNNDDTQPADKQWNNSFMNQLQQQVNNFPREPLSNDEISSLRFMREEEKLARDVYLKLYDEWKLTPFLHIAESEQNHMDAVWMLLNKYNLNDPVTNDAEGIFVDPTLKQMYTDLIAQGLKSEIDALKVGALIEEVDINDLQLALDNTFDNQDFIHVYNNLLKGSRNHLRAFYKNLEMRNVTYMPQVLSQEAFDAIVYSEKEYGGF